MNVIIDCHVNSNKDRMISSALERNGQSYLLALVEALRGLLPQASVLVATNKPDIVPEGVSILETGSLKATRTRWAGLVRMARSREDFEGRDLLVASPLAGVVHASRVQSFLEQVEQKQGDKVYVSLRELPVNKHPAWLLAFPRTQAEGDGRCIDNAVALDWRKYLPGELLEIWPAPGKCLGSQFLPELYEEDHALAFCPSSLPANSRLEDPSWREQIFCPDVPDTSLPLLCKTPVYDLYLD